jgi:aminoglycoside N3'-acetyltransferase
MGVSLQSSQELQAFSKSLIYELISAVGPTGLVCFPAFSYSWPRGLVFDPTDSATVEPMGLLSKTAFELGFSRTPDPIFSCLVSGSRAIELFPQTSASFGPGSTFAALVDRNSRVICIGLDTGSTLLHELEFRHDVSYRRVKTFCGQTLNEAGNLENGCWESYVRDLSLKSTEPNFHRLHTASLQRGIVRTTKYGRRSSFSFKIEDVFVLFTELVKLNPHFLVSGSDSTGR